MSSDPAYDAVTRARNQENGGNPQGAAVTLENYLATDPHNVYARIELARIYAYALNDKEKSAFQLQIILDLDPDNMDALKASVTLRSNDKWRRHETDEEYARLVSLVEARGDSAETAAVCAAYAVFLRKQMGSYEKAAEYYERAVAAAPDRYEYHQDYAVLLLNELRDYVKARHVNLLYEPKHENNFSQIFHLQQINLLGVIP